MTNNTPTPNREAVTAEMIVAAIRAHSAEPTSRDMGARKMRATLIASGLPAEVEQLREELIGWRKRWQETDDDATAMRAELTRLRGKLSKARDVIREARKQIAVAPHSLAYDLTLLPKLDAALKDQQP